MAATLTGSIIDSYGRDNRDQHSNGSLNRSLLQKTIDALHPSRFHCHAKEDQTCTQLRVESTSDDDDGFECIGFRRTSYKSFLFIVYSVLSMGALLLVCYWNPALKCKLRYKKCPIACAQLLLIKLDGVAGCLIVPIEQMRIQNVNSECDSDSTTSGSNRNNSYKPYQGEYDPNGCQVAGVENVSGSLSSLDDGQMLIASSADSFKVKNASLSDCSRNLAPGASMDELLKGSVVLTFMLKNLRFVWYPKVESDVSGNIVNCSCGMVALDTFDAMLTMRDIVNTTHRVTHSSSYDTNSKAAFDKRDNRSMLYGVNSMVVPVKSYYRLLVEEVFNPFYVFQIVSILLWCCEDYYYYASCILVISVVSIILEVREIRHQAITLRDMSTITGTINLVLPTESAASSVCEVNGTISRGGTGVHESKLEHDPQDETRNGEFKLKEVTFEDLVPGDLIEIGNRRSKIPVDCVLVAGTVIVNESCLTGESVPVNKTPLRPSGTAEQKIDFATQAKHLLFAGTDIVRVNHSAPGEVVMAYVLRTGFMTVRGQMIRSMLHPKPMDSLFYKDAFRFVGVLSILAIAGTVYSIYDLLNAGDTIFDAVTTGLDIITILVPPALPSALSIGIHYAIARLKKGGIFCISPQRVNLAGQIDIFCFDKTGTLTEEGLDIYGFLPAVKKPTSQESEKEDEKFVVSFSTLAEEPKATFQIQDPISVGMATCHSLVVVDEEVCGDPIEVKMFDSIGWQIHNSSQGSGTDTDSGLFCVRPSEAQLSRTLPQFDPDLNQYLNYEVATLHELPFSSHVQRMSVVVKRVGCPCSVQHNMELFCKGAPEVVASLCVQESIPCDFTERLRFYTNQGFRVLAMAGRDLGPKVKYHKMLKMERVVLEQEMTFLGLLVLQNKLKPESTAAIETLTKNDIRSVMITGDNLETAASVAQECRIVLPSETLLFVRCTPEVSHSLSGSGGSANAVEIAAVTASNRNGKQIQSLHDVTPSSSSASIVHRISLHHSSNNQPLTPSEYTKLLYNSSITFAISGADYRNLRENFSSDVLAGFAQMCSVYSRMKPDQKTQVVKSLQDLGHMVGMCGDGSNDCSALKAAHAGVALSQADASVASPFTSKVENISCVHRVIQEGRCALVTSFALFKFMMLYSMVQYSSIQLLYVIQSNLGDTEQMYEDMVLITILALLMGRTGPASNLVPQRPQNRLLSFSVVLSVFACTIIQMSAQLAAFFYVRAEPWYHPWKSDNGKTVVEKGYENTAVFIVSNFQYVFSALVFSKGFPYRKPFYTNRAFSAALLGLIALNLVLMLYPPKFLADFFEMVPVDDHHLFILVIGEFCIINLLLLFLMENIVIGFELIERSFKCLIYLCYKCCSRRGRNTSCPYVNNAFIKTVSQIYI